MELEVMRSVQVWHVWEMRWDVMQSNVKSSKLDIWFCGFLILWQGYYFGATLHNQKEIDWAIVYKQMTIKHTVGSKRLLSVWGMQHFALSDTLHPTFGQVSQCFPFVTSQIFLWYPVDIQLCTMATAFLHYRTTCAQLGWAVQCFPFLLQFKYFSDILQMSGQTPDVWICAMATAFLYHQTTCAQLGQVFRCFSFHNISPFLLPDLFSSSN